MADDKSKPDQPAKLRPEDTVWVICTSPVTLLMPTTERKLQPGGKDAPGLEPLRLERGINVLAGVVVLGEGEPKVMTIEGLPAKVQQLPPAERVAAVIKSFAAARERYRSTFERTGDIPAAISAVGTMAEIVAKHTDLLMTAASKGTHKGSLEALSVHPGVAPHIRELARARLDAWRPAG